MSTPTKAELVAQYGEADGFADCGADGPDNLDRVGWAFQAVMAFGRETGQDVDDLENLKVNVDEIDGYAYEVVGDLIGDLFHLLTYCGYDPEAVIEQGRSHFVAEAGMGYGDDEEDEGKPVPYVGTTPKYNGVGVESEQGC